MPRQPAGARTLHTFFSLDHRLPMMKKGGHPMLASVRAPSRPAFAPSRIASLTGGARVDVCIVGGGLEGMFAAYLLAREKRSVMVMDEGPAAAFGGAEGVHLSSMIEQPYHELESVHGEVSARLAAQS